MPVNLFIVRVFARYVEVFEANPKDVARAKELEAGGGRGGGLATPRRRATTSSVVTLRGLPYRYT
jgi:hypothetical protein